MAEEDKEKMFKFDKRRFPRLQINIQVQIFSMNKVLLGKGVTQDISASGIRIMTDIAQSLRQGTEVFVTFLLPEGPAVEKLRGEIKGIIKSTAEQEIRLRFSEFRALDILKEYIEKKLNQ
jgi:hypothetical protein